MATKNSKKCEHGHVLERQWLTNATDKWYPMRAIQKEPPDTQPGTLLPNISNALRMD